MTTQFAHLKEHLARVKEQEAEILAQIEAQQEQALADLLAEILDKIDACGFDREKIAMAIAPKLGKAAKKAKTKTTGARKQGAVKTYFNPADPSQTYSKGPAPAWLKEMMESAGVDTEDKAAVKAFRESNLLVQGAESVQELPQEAPEPLMPPAWPPALAG
ncbi:MAG: H-NS histone family protein [Gammaproteobacteria bacterium]|nr:H-NS histone family protein [Gammaproteobacteria bacterium]